MDYQKNEVQKDPMAKLDSAKVKLDQIAQMKAQLVSENFKVSNSICQSVLRFISHKLVVSWFFLSAKSEEKKKVFSIYCQKGIFNLLLHFSYQQIITFIDKIILSYLFSTLFVP